MVPWTRIFSGKDGISPGKIGSWEGPEAPVLSEFAFTQCVIRIWTGGARGILGFCDLLSEKVPKLPRGEAVGAVRATSRGSLIHSCVLNDQETISQQVHKLKPTTFKKEKES